MAQISRAEREQAKREIMVKIDNDPEVTEGTRKVAEEVRAYWADVAWPTAVGSKTGAGHPYETGAYRESIKVVQNRAPKGAEGGIGGRYIEGFTVKTDSPHANFIEYGTGPDKPGSKSPWGPNTPTPEYAPAARTAHHFGGTPD